MSILTKKKLAGLTLGLCAGLAGTMAAAEPAPGCYMRMYDPAHLAAQPQQWVEAISMWIEAERNGNMRAASLAVLPRDAAPTDPILMMAISCRLRENGTTDCASWCGDDVIDITASDASGLTFRTQRLIVSPQAQCNGGRDLAEVPGQATLYRLEKVEDGLCG